MQLGKTGTISSLNMPTATAVIAGKCIVGGSAKLRWIRSWCPDLVENSLRHSTEISLNGACVLKNTVKSNGATKQNLKAT